MVSKAQVCVPKSPFDASASGGFAQDDRRFCAASNQMTRQIYAQDILK